MNKRESKKSAAVGQPLMQQLFPYSFLDDYENTSNTYIEKINVPFEKMQSWPAPRLLTNKTPKMLLSLIRRISGILYPITHLTKSASHSISIIFLNLWCSEIACEVCEYLTALK